MRKIVILMVIICFFNAFVYAQNLIQNPGCEEELVNGEIPNWNEVVGSNWTQRSSNPNAYEGDYYFFAGEGSNAELMQEVNVSQFTNYIDNNKQYFSFEGYVRSYDDSDPDDTQIIIEYLDSLKITVLDLFDSGEFTSIDQWAQIYNIRLAPAGTRFIRVRLISTRNSGTNNDGYFDALSLLAVSSQNILPNLLLNPGCEEELVNGEIPNWNEVVGSNWTQRSSDPNAYEGNYYFFAGEGSNAELMQEVNVSPFVYYIDANLQKIYFNCYVRSWDQSPPDGARVIIEYLDSLKTTVLDLFDSGEYNSKYKWVEISNTQLAPIGTRFIRVRLISKRHCGSNNDGYFDDLYLTAGIETNFIADKRFGYSSLEVNFNDESTGLPTSWEWDFQNDGIVDSYDKNPSYTYTEPGLYTVKLKVEKGTFQDSIIKNNYIVVQVQELIAPQNIIIEKSDNNIILKWDIVPYADYYIIYKSPEPYGDFEFLDYNIGNGNTNYTHSGIVIEKNTMFYFVIGFDGTLNELLKFIEKNKIKKIDY